MPAALKLLAIVLVVFGSALAGYFFGTHSARRYHHRIERDLAHQVITTEGVAEQIRELAKIRFYYHSLRTWPLNDGQWDYGPINEPLVAGLFVVDSVTENPNQFYLELKRRHQH